MQKIVLLLHINYLVVNRILKNTRSCVQKCLSKACRLCTRSMKMKYIQYKKMFYKLSLILSYKPKLAKLTQYLITMIKKG